MWMESWFGFAGPPPLTPPLKGEGDEAGFDLPPSPLRGGIEGGGPAKPNQDSIQ